MRCWRVDRLAALAALTGLLASGDFAAAQTREQAQQQCREKLRPAVQACVQKLVKEKGGPAQKHADGCRQSQGDAFRACVGELTARGSPPPEKPQEAAVDPSKLKLTRAPGFAAPPRTIADITAIFDQQKPDPERAARNRVQADATPSSSGPLGPFYYARCQARANLGRARDAIPDCEKAIELGGDYRDEISIYTQFLSNQYRQIGEFKKSIEIERAMAERLSTMERVGGRFFGINIRIALAYNNLGERIQAEGYFKRNQDLLRKSRGWQNTEMYRSNWASTVENGNARMFEAQGRYAEAEAAYSRAQTLLRDAMAKAPSWPIQPPAGAMESTLDFLAAYEGQIKFRQGGLAEAESAIRRALLGRLKTVGKYHSDTAQISVIFTRLLVETGRFAEAEKMARTTVEIYRTLEYPEDMPIHAFALNQLATTLQTQRRFQEAAEIYARLDVATKDWPPARQDAIRLNWSRIFTAYLTNNVQAGIDLARTAMDRQRQRVGERHFDYAVAQAVLAAGLSYARRDSEALPLFKTAMPLLIAATREGDTDDATEVAAHDRRMQAIAESYLLLLSRAQDASGANAIESFRLGEMVRGQSVQKALASSSARAATADPALAELVRQEQDLEKQVAATLGNINNQLALSPEERDDKELREMQADVAKLRAARRALRRDIERKFPSYAELVVSRPPTVDDVRAAIKPGETFLSFYFGRRAAFVWAIPKEGPVAFASVPGSAASFDDKVNKLREALDPQASSISEIPPFDVKLAHELYSQLLKPVEQGWKGAKDLIVATNGALGLLPLGLLPVEPPEPPTDGDLLFSGYRKVAWLARSHAITMVPSAAALRTLRHLPPSSPDRETMIGFGDPFFSEQQLQQSTQPDAMQLASAAATTRGVPLMRRNSPKTMGVDSAELGLLPRLPDTADELKSIALALQADPSKVLHLGKQANEAAVKTMNLSKYKIVVFATHGLVPGELNGLHQPALAMSAPDVAGHDGDGLLTMEEILALKLDADWVVLSACNTGAGAGAGAEAASGLGRAFFYAGTRAILVTNWAVHSVSARELVTDLFRRQANDGKLSRGEALRQAMVELHDKGAFTDERGKPLFAYAHPLFWAPYTIIGDGGAL